MSTSSWVRGLYIMRRFGANAALGERAMSLKIANHKVVDCLVRMNCNPRADGDWLYWRACELQDTALCTIILDGIQPSKQTLGHFVNVAAMKGAASIIDLIVEHYGADIHQPDGEDRVLMLACAENRVDIVRHLVEQYGCDVHSNKERHLRRACLHGHVELVELLLPGADVHAYNDAALQNAAHAGHTEIVKMLLDAGANAQANRNAPLQYAVINSDLTSIKLLINAGADPRVHQDRALRHACRRNAMDIVEYLLQLGADPNALEGSPLREALRSANESIIKLLLEHGADPNSSGALRGMDEMIKQKNKDIISLMVNAGTKADIISSSSSSSSTPLMDENS
ncbi:hypothetical protein O0I10_009351 [Lichtheimia ornata]|uniref:Ankyrin repeat protein n=1 Tax=Lichtheimia ornata TaxID=688661 RepID=A0AAD7UX88_9FUNG|nr:uncharacterized protein O0I10_009351 [Lichtheimia ornata]KAJ8654955.1 hypothetical protein O0I10_009351 [Lichtheimia ornata]